VSSYLTSTVPQAGDTGAADDAAEALALGQVSRASAVEFLESLTAKVPSGADMARDGEAQMIQVRPCCAPARPPAPLAIICIV
jgi:hypothetical protein